MKIKRIKMLMTCFGVMVVGLSFAKDHLVAWVPDAWDVYPEEFHKIYQLSSQYVLPGMDEKYLTIKNFKGKSYKPAVLDKGPSLLQQDIATLDMVSYNLREPGLKILANKFKQDSQNDDVVGWIYVPGTNINYPIVQHPTDTDYYAKRNYWKFENKREDYGFPGVVWVASECRFSVSTSKQFSENVVFYGHNWENYKAPPAYNEGPKINDYLDIMFSQLNCFHNFDFAKERPYIYISTLDQNFVLKIFAVFYTEDEFKYHHSNIDRSEKLNILQEALMRSRFIYNSPVYLDDKIFTFSTCTRAYGKGREDQKFVIMARLLRADESVDDVLDDNYILENKNHKQPKLINKK